MAFTNSNDILDGRAPTVFPSGSEVVVQPASIALLTGDLTLNNIGAVGVLPAGCVPVAMYVDSAELDSGTNTITLDIGLLNDAGTDFDTTFATGLTVAQAGGVVQVLSANLLRLAKASGDRKIGVKVSAAPNVAQAGSVFIHTHYRAA